MFGAIVPHAPLLLPQVTGPETHRAAAAIRTGVRRLGLDDAGLIVLLSPHGVRTGVYGAIAGSLDDFGLGGVRVRQATDPGFARRLAERWGKPLLADPVDHGVVVPLLMANLSGVPVVAATLAENGSSEAPVVAEARSFARAVAELEGDREITFVASGNTSAALSPRAPLTERAEALTVETRLLEVLERGEGFSDDLALELGRDGGSCGVGPLVALFELCGDVVVEVLVHEHPVGVGYLVARARVRA